MTRMTVNGEAIHYKLDPDTPLLWALRDASNLTGTKYGCDSRDCGACTVIIDGRRAPPGQSVADRRADCGIAEHLPLRRLSANPEGDPPGGAGRRARRSSPFTNMNIRLRNG